jgi:hypothetical protein
MILLNSEKQCIYMYRGRRRRAAASSSKTIIEILYENKMEGRGR